MKAEAARWRSISSAEQEAEIESETLSDPYEEALQRLEEERRQSVIADTQVARDDIAL